MQHTTKYKFNLIETSDTFSPDALNANAEAVEKELAALASAHAADKAALEKADAAVRSEFAAADKALADAHAADKAALEKTAADNKTTLEQSIASTKTALQTAMGSGGKTCRIAYGSYVGYEKSVTVDFKPLVLFLSYLAAPTRHHIMIRDCAYSFTTASAASNVTWGDRTVSWEDKNSAQGTSTVNYYVVIGESA